MLQVGVWRITKIERLLVFAFSALAILVKIVGKNRGFGLQAEIGETSYYPLSVPNLVMSTCQNGVVELIPFAIALPELVASLA